MGRVASSPETEAGILNEGATGYLTINLLALARNYAKLGALVAPAQTAAVVKADAYGLGALRLAPTLYKAGCRHFFVAQFDEAVKLRPVLAADAKVFVLNGLQPGNEEACAAREIIPILNSLEQWRRWLATAKRWKRTLPAAVQFDTGMSRLGVPPEERSALASELAGQGNIEILFIMSHLASADELDSDQNDDQLAEMKRISEEFTGLDICFALRRHLSREAIPRSARPSGHRTLRRRPNGPGAEPDGGGGQNGRRCRADAYRSRGRKDRVRRGSHRGQRNPRCDHCCGLCRWIAPEPERSRCGLLQGNAPADCRSRFHGQHHLGHHRIAQRDFDSGKSGRGARSTSNDRRCCPRCWHHLL